MSSNSCSYWLCSSILCSKQMKCYWWPTLLPSQRVLQQPVRYDSVILSTSVMNASSLSLPSIIFPLFPLFMQFVAKVNVVYDRHGIGRRTRGLLFWLVLFLSLYRLYDHSTVHYPPVHVCHCCRIIALFVISVCSYNDFVFQLQDYVKIGKYLHGLVPGFCFSSP